MSGTVERLGYIGVGAADLPAWEDFATNVLGVAIHDRGDDGTLFLRHDKHHYRIAVHPDPSDDLLYIGWQVANDAALDAVRARLGKHGVAFDEGGADLAAKRRVADLITLSDPSGVALEISHSPLMDYANPFHSPRPVRGFVTDDQGLGHMVMTVDDFEVSKRFYREVLGMRLSDYIERPMGERTMRIDDVGSTYDICFERGILNTTIGKHPNDKMISFYLHSPSGWLFEYGYGARTVDDDVDQVERFTVISEWGHLRPEGGRYGDARRAAS